MQNVSCVECTWKLSSPWKYGLPQMLVPCKSLCCIMCSDALSELVVEVKHGVRRKICWSGQLDSELTWGKPGTEVRGDEENNVRKEERIKDETAMENMCYDLMGYWIMELGKEGKQAFRDYFQCYFNWNIVSVSPGFYRIQHGIRFAWSRKSFRKYQAWILVCFWMLCIC